MKKFENEIEDFLNELEDFFAQTLKTTLKKLVEEGLVEMKKENGKEIYKMTAKGKEDHDMQKRLRLN